MSDAQVPGILSFRRHHMETLDFDDIAAWVKRAEDKFGKKLRSLQIEEHAASFVPGYSAFLIISSPIQHMEYRFGPCPICRQDHESTRRFKCQKCGEVLCESMVFEQSKRTFDCEPPEGWNMLHFLWCDEFNDQWAERIPCGPVVEVTDMEAASEKS